MIPLLRWRTAEGLRWYQVVCRLACRLGLIMWQRAIPLADLVALIEGPAWLEPARALDIGCDTIYLAAHG
jgi:hypothetical protein